MRAHSSSLPSLVIGGPTASGKTQLALEIAQRCGGAIINADAFQIYRGLPLLTAQPTAEELAQAPHHLVGEIPLSQSFDAACYLALARERLTQCRATGRLPILVGGTGLYIKALLYGLSEGLPGPDANLRADLEQQPLDALRTRLATLDPEAIATVDLQNPRRVIRALEVCILTGKAFTSFRLTAPWCEPPIGIWVSPKREDLHQRIAGRAGRLFASGVEEEVRRALPEVGMTSQQTIGLKQVASVLEGTCSREEAISQITAATRQYARRQETWLRKEAALVAIPPEQALEKGLSLLKDQ